MDDAMREGETFLAYVERMFGDRLVDDDYMEPVPPPQQPRREPWTPEKDRAYKLGKTIAERELWARQHPHTMTTERWGKLAELKAELKALREKFYTERKEARIQEFLEREKGASNGDAGKPRSTRPRTRGTDETQWGEPIPDEPKRRIRGKRATAQEGQPELF